MTTLLLYLLKVNIVLIVLYGFYFLFLRKDSFYGYHRWYLLFVIAAMFVLPLVDISGWTERNGSVVETSQYIPDMGVVYQMIFLQPLQGSETVEPEVVPDVPKNVSPSNILIFCLLAGTILLISNRIYQLYRLVCMRTRFSEKYIGEQTVISMDSPTQPFSFFGRIFLNPTLYTDEELAEIVAHEQIHCREKHTLDILLAEAVVCLCWINPVAWLLRNDIRQNLEYYTDRCVIQNGFNRKHYQYSLLRISGGNLHVVNHFHFNHLKKRIIMMNRKESTKIISAKYLLVIPAMMAAVLLTQASGLKAVDNTTNEPLLFAEPEIAVLTEQLVQTLPDNPESKSEQVVEIEKRPLQPQQPQQPQNLQQQAQQQSLQPQQAQQPQSKLVTGTVIDVNNNPLAGVNVIVIGKNGGVVTDMNGKYAITVSENDMLRFIFWDKKDVPIIVGKQTVINVCLLDEKSNDEQPHVATDTLKNYNTGNQPLIIVDGFETSNKLMNHIDPSAIESIEVLKETSTIAKYGDKAKNGVVIIKTKVNANGLKNSSFNGINDPLLIIDGEETPYNFLNSLNSNAIESIDILKNDSAISQYGDKAKNGVILITTKKDNPNNSLTFRMRQ